MSRMYDSKPLENLPVQLINWTGSFEKDYACLKSSKENPGLLCDAKIANQARIHIASSESNTQTRFYLLFTTIERAHRRKYDDSGVEQEPNFSDTTKVSTGYLNSSYDVKSKGQSDLLSKEEVASITQDAKIQQSLKDVVEKKTNNADIVLLMREQERLKIDLNNESFIRVKTLGNSPFIESLIVRDDLTSTTGNFVGDEKMGNSWIEKIVAAKAAATDEEEPSEIADEEWDD